MDRIATGPSDCQPLVEQLLPANSVHLLAGAPGAGKTCLAAWLLRQVQDGAPVFGFATHPPAAIAVVVADRGWVSHAQWFAAAGLSTIRHYSLHDDRAFPWSRLKSPDGWMATLHEILEHRLGDLPPRSLILIDPLSVFLGGDLLNYARVFCAMGELSQRCVARLWTVLGTAHAAKQRQGRQFQYVRPQDRILGTTALVGCADTVMYLAMPEESGREHWELHWAPHHAPAGSCRLARQADGLFTPIGAPMVANRALQHERALLEVITDTPQPTRALVKTARAQGISRASVFRALQQLVDRQLVVGAQGQWRRATPH